MGYYNRHNVSQLFAINPKHDYGGNNGTLASGASFVADVPSQFSANVYSVSFDGSIGQISNTSNFTVPNAGAISFWFKATTFVGTPFMFSGSHDVLGIDSSQNKGFVLVTGGSNTLPLLSTTLSTNTWYHCVINRLGDGTATIYINGSAGTNTSIGTGDMILNGMSNYPSERLNGNMCEVRVFTSTLSGTDISNLAAGNAPVTQSVAHWKMNEGSGIYVWDYIT